MKKALLVLFLLLLLTTCSQQIVQSPVPLITTTTTAAAQPTQTEAPSSTTPVRASDTPTPTYTHTPTETPSLTPTIDPCSKAVCSPDGRYVAKLSHGDGSTTIDRIEIRERNGTTIWTIYTQLEIPNVDPHPGLDIYRWSMDSAILYFHYNSLPDGGEYAFWWDGFDLQSFNIVTGTIQKVFPGANLVSFAFSPDETSLAYARSHDEPYVIYIRDLATGLEKSTIVESGDERHIRIGNIQWSPTKKGLAFQTEKMNYWVQTFYLDIETMQLKVINEYKLFDLEFRGWTDDGKLIFVPAQGEIIIINPTGETVTPTP